MESTGNVENVRRTRVRNDRVFPETRWVSVIIVPFLVTAFVILYLFPDQPTTITLFKQLRAGKVQSLRF